MLHVGVNICSHTYNHKDNGTVLDYGWKPENSTSDSMHSVNLLSNQRLTPLHTIKTMESFRFRLQVKLVPDGNAPPLSAAIKCSHSLKGCFGSFLQFHRLEVEEEQPRVTYAKIFYEVNGQRSREL